MVRALRTLGIDAVAHVPSRLSEGHGLSVRAVERARLEEVETQDRSRPANGTIVVLAPDGPGVIVTEGRFYLTRVIFRGLPLEGEAFVNAAGLRPGVLLA
jgi:hypothetical protein